MHHCCLVEEFSGQGVQRRWTLYSFSVLFKICLECLGDALISSNLSVLAVHDHTIHVFATITNKQYDKQRVLDCHKKAFQIAKITL